MPGEKTPTALVPQAHVALGSKAGVPIPSQEEEAGSNARSVSKPKAPPEDGVVYASFWQHPLVQNLLPFATSVVFHVSLLIIGILLFATSKIISQSVIREQVIIPEASIVAGATVGGLPNPGLGNDPNLSGAQTVESNITVADGWANKRSESLAMTLMGGGATDASDSVIGLGPKSGLVGSGSQGIGGNASQGGGPLSPYGPGGGMGLAPKSPFMGISGNARKVVYICDASGSMMSVKDRVHAELVKAINVLSPIQAFNVIFSLNEDVTPLSRDSLVMATPQNKKKAIELAEGIAYAGPTGPIPAIRLAFAQKPELIYVLTDGFEAVPSYDDVIKEFDRLNQDKKVKVNTIMIRGSTEPELERVLQTIAFRNGGICKIVDRQQW